MMSHNYMFSRGSKSSKDSNSFSMEFGGRESITTIDRIAYDLVELVNSNEKLKKTDQMTKKDDQIAYDLVKLNNLNGSSNIDTRQSKISTSTKLSEKLQSPTTTTVSISMTSPRRSMILTDIEQKLLRSSSPIETNETDEITVLGQRGIWINKSEVNNWRGEIDINEYLINEDPNPEIISKKVTQNIEYIQELAIRYLRPPTPPAPGEIVITQESDYATKPAPPLIIRQQPLRTETPEPLVIREVPPVPPKAVGLKSITISGKRIPPPPRKVVIERFAQLPSKPQNVIIERWLPYNKTKRRVIFNKSNDTNPVVVKPKNVIIQWEAPNVEIKKEFKHLDIIKANPVEYVQQYGNSLLSSKDLPSFVREIQAPSGLTLAHDSQINEYPELEGDIQALNLIDLDKEGLSHYKYLLNRNSTSSRNTIRSSASESRLNFDQFQTQRSIIKSPLSINQRPSTSNINEGLIERIFKRIDLSKDGIVNRTEAEKIFLKLNSRLGRAYGEDDIDLFFTALDVNNDGSIDFVEFKKAFTAIVI